jgi:beta-lactamase class A
MRKTSPFPILRWMSLVLLAMSIGLMILQLIAFSRLRANYPPGLMVAGVPIGNLNRQEAAQRLLEVYSLPVELNYNDSIIQMPVSHVNFSLDIESMLAAAELDRTSLPFWQGFWDYLWGRSSSPKNVPLVISYSEDSLRAFLRDQVAVRYDQPPSPAKPIPGSVEFVAGEQGTQLDIDRAVILIDTALRSSSVRRVNLPLGRSNPDRPTLQNLDILIKQTIADVAGFEGTIGFYVSDLQTGQEVTFVYENKILVTTPPDVSFTASSTLKIPIMVSAFRRLGDNLETDNEMTPQVIEQLDNMISRSDNQATDWIMENILDPIRGPLVVTNDMKELGLENTFLAGYFYQGAPLLFRFETPGNRRTDVNVERDPYSQTTAAEIGMLLEDIYQCATVGGGSLVAVFPGEITTAECQLMIQYLKNDRTPWLILAGLPDGTEVAHKHGWVSDQFGIIHDMSDAGIVFTKSGDYVLSVFLYHPTQLVFEPGNQLVADISRAVYNFFNLPAD